MPGLVRSGEINLKTLGIGTELMYSHRAMLTSMAWQKNEQSRQAMGESRGGSSTKIHAAGGAVGNPLRLLLTA